MTYVARRPKIIIKIIRVHLHKIATYVARRTKIAAKISLLSFLNLANFFNKFAVFYNAVRSLMLDFKAWEPSDLALF